MVAAFLRFILFILVAYFVFLALRLYAAFKRMKTAARGQGRPASKVQGVMVKDEVCGTYIPREEALTEVRDGVEHYFCSEECRRKGLAR